MPARKFITLHLVVRDHIHYPAGAEIFLDDEAEADRLVRLGAVCTMDEYQRRLRAREEAHTRNRPSRAFGG